MAIGPENSRWVVSKEQAGEKRVTQNMITMCLRCFSFVVPYCQSFVVKSIRSFVVVNTHRVGINGDKSIKFFKHDNKVDE